VVVVVAVAAAAAAQAAILVGLLGAPGFAAAAHGGGTMCGGVHAFVRRVERAAGGKDEWSERERSRQPSLTFLHNEARPEEENAEETLLSVFSPLARLTHTHLTPRTR
jgi:hypothetical protein